MEYCNIGDGSTGAALCVDDYRKIGKRSFGAGLALKNIEQRPITGVVPGIELYRAASTGTVPGIEENKAPTTPSALDIEEYRDQ